MTMDDKWQREKFEDWYTRTYLGADVGASLDRYGDGYKQLDTHFCWLGWQAAWQSLLADLKAEMIAKIEGLRKNGAVVNFDSLTKPIPVWNSAIDSCLVTIQQLEAA